jgi:hypothetical protein
MELKIDYVQKPWETALNTTQTANHEHITKAINRLLQAGFEDEFLGYARCYRLLKTRMRSLKCSRRGYFPPPCVHDVLVRDLDTMQRYACFEFQRNVRLATSNRLPSELVHLVFEYTMMAEGVQIDPRVLVEAQDPVYKERTHLKSRLACSHPADIAYVAGERERLWPGWVTGDEWEEKYPDFPHSQMRDMEDMMNSILCTGVQVIAEEWSEQWRE